MKEDDSPPLIVTEAEAGERLDKILAGRFSEIHSRSYFQNLIENHCVLLNGEPIKKRIKPHAGDEIEVEFILTPEIDLVPEQIPFEILYEDEDLLVINKPVGMVVHPAPGHWTGTFVNGLLYHCRSLPTGSSLRPGIVHRLDKDTSGLLVAAKTLLAQQRLIEQFSSRKIYKEYLAVCVGNPGQGQQDSPIGRHPVHRQRMAVVPTGRPALTFFETQATHGNLSLVKLVIATGRTHQIRVHMQQLGTPVLGDPVYGFANANKQYGLAHQLLHASILRLTHPISGHPMEFKAPLPTMLAAFLKKHGLQVGN